MRVRVSYGASNLPEYFIDGDSATVQEVFDEISGGLNIPSNAEVFVNGSASNFNRSLSTGDHVEFKKASGTKG